MGVILAGGRGRRIGGAKALIELNGRPLISYPLQAMRVAVNEVAVVAKSETELPELPAEVMLWHEPDEPSHPLVGILHALKRAAGRSVLVCAVDMPFVTSRALRLLATAPAGAAPAVVASADRALQPQLARYEPAALALLEPALGKEPALGEGPGREGPALGEGPGRERAIREGASLRELIAAVGPRRLELGDPGLLFNVNAPADLAEAERILTAG